MSETIPTTTTTNAEHEKSSWRKVRMFEEVQLNGVKRRVPTLLVTLQKDAHASYIGLLW